MSQHHGQAEHRPLWRKLHRPRTALSAADLRRPHRSGADRPHLINALKGNRVAHAYLFTGARGVGKTSTARISPKRSTAKRDRRRRPAASATSASASPAATTPTSSKSTAPANNGVDDAPRDARQHPIRGPAGRDIRYTSSTKSTCSPKAAFNALPQDARRAARARQIHLRHHRSAERFPSPFCRAASASTSPAFPPTKFSNN